MPEPRCWVTEWRTSHSTPWSMATSIVGRPTTTGDLPMKSCSSASTNCRKMAVSLSWVGSIDSQGAGLAVCSRPLRDENRLARPGRTVHENDATVGGEDSGVPRGASDGSRTTALRGGRPWARAHRTPPFDRPCPCRWSRDGSGCWFEPSARCVTAVSEPSITISPPPLGDLAGCALSQCHVAGTRPRSRNPKPPRSLRRNARLTRHPRAQTASILTALALNWLFI